MDVKENIPIYAPSTRGRSVDSTSFPNASQSQDKNTRISHTCFVILVNRAPVIWCSKQKSTVDTSTLSN